MVCIAVLSQIVFSICIVRLRSVFTVEIAGLMVMLTGVRIGQIGLKLLFHATDGSGASNIDLTAAARSEEHTSELQSLMRSSYAVFCLKKKKSTTHDDVKVSQTGIRYN